MNHAGYLDHNATTPVRPEAAAAAAAVLAMTGNPSSVHRFGREMRRRLEDAREQVAGLVGAAPAEIVFTSGGTEANALAVRGCGRRRVLISAIEHASVQAAAGYPGNGAVSVPVDADGRVDCQALDAMLGADPAPALIAVMLANNETGVIQPVAEVAAVARRHGALVHCDAVQAAGKIAVDAAALGVHFLSISAHKIGGPAGSGALVVRGGAALAAELGGGGQERGRRAGTENLAGIVGFGAAAVIAAADLSAAGRLAPWRDDLERRVLGLAPATRIFGAGVARLPNTSCLAMPGVTSAVQLMAFDLAGLAVSAGSACSSGKVARSHVLEAMGIAAGEAANAIRVSLGWTTTPQEIDRFVAAWGALYARLGARSRRAAPAA
jgi:cysteine desulfurase